MSLWLWMEWTKLWYANLCRWLFYYSWIMWSGSLVIALLLDFLFLKESVLLSAWRMQLCQWMVWTQMWQVCSLLELSEQISKRLYKTKWMFVSWTSRLTRQNLQQYSLLRFVRARYFWWNSSIPFYFLKIRWSKIVSKEMSWRWKL